MFPALIRVLGSTAAALLLLGSSAYGQQQRIEGTDLVLPLVNLGEIVVFNPEGRDIRCFFQTVTDRLACQLEEQRDAIRRYHDMLALQREMIRIVRCLGESAAPPDCVSPPSYKVVPPVPGNALLSEIKGLDNDAREAAKSALIEEIDRERDARIEYVNQFF